MGYRTSVDLSLFEDAENERFGIVARGRLGDVLLTVEI
jgi:hypothetical protein